ncbi:hypothetical protein [Candidatus Uabimicrobium sp. HlEnr_7]|uniref:hypothetical protein n=1 Tax=Candidatus Uabimicrobium helgolandensis TaxID=3095367 RepID=UPI0035585E34
MRNCSRWSKKSIGRIATGIALLWAWYHIDRAIPKDVPKDITATPKPVPVKDKDKKKKGKYYVEVAIFSEAGPARLPHVAINIITPAMPRGQATHRVAERLTKEQGLALTQAVRAGNNAIIQGLGIASQV